MESLADTPQTRPGLAVRRDAILEAGKQVFFEEGYATASMDRIAERAGVTKRTVYAHFPSKQALFAQVVVRACANVVGQIPRPDSLPADPATGMRLLLGRVHELMDSANCVSLQRIVAAEAERHPEFAATLRQAFEQGEAIMARAIDLWVAAGRLKPHDTRLAARMFNDLVGYSTSLRGMIGGIGGEDQARAATDQAVALYLAAYGAA